MVAAAHTATEDIHPASRQSWFGYARLMNLMAICVVCIAGLFTAVRAYDGAHDFVSLGFSITVLVLSLLAIVVQVFWAGGLLVWLELLLVISVAFLWMFIVLCLGEDFRTANVAIAAMSILLLYWVVLLVAAIIAHRRGRKVWARSVAVLTLRNAPEVFTDLGPRRSGAGAV